MKIHEGTPSRINDQGVICFHQDDVNLWEIRLRAELAATAPSHGYGTCLSCKLPWWVVQGHAVEFSDGSACFPICEMCWKALGRERAFPFYEDWLSTHYPEISSDVLRENILGKPYSQSLPGKEQL